MISQGGRLAILANNGDVGGGEVMLLQLAEAARRGGYDVTVVAPAAPAECADAAQAAGFPVARIPGEGRRAYMRNLRRWARSQTGLLWCNGLVPATATALLRRPRRVVHLHRLPEGPQRVLARLARMGASACVVLSTFMVERLGYGEVLRNWSPAHPSPPVQRFASAPAVVGFLGRLSPDKGVVELAEAVSRLNAEGLPVHLLLAGEPRFVDEDGQREVEAALRGCEAYLTRGGWMDRSELFGRIDLLAVPSRWEEPFGLVATEAMAAGVPLVISASGALPEIVGEGYPFVARRGDAEDLARVLRAAIRDPETTRRLAERAHVRWEHEFSPEAGEGRFLSLLDRLTSTTERPRP